MVDLIDIFGTSLIGIMSLVFANFLIKTKKKKDYAKTILSICFVYSSFSSVFRILDLIFNIEIFENLWIFTGISFSLGISIIGLIIIFNKKEKKLFNAFLILEIVFLILTLINSNILNLLNPTIGIFSLVLFVYLFFNYRLSNIFFYLISLIIFVFGGLTVFLYGIYSIMYSSYLFAFLIMYLNFKIKTQKL